MIFSSKIAERLAQIQADNEQKKRQTIYLKIAEQFLAILIELDIEIGEITAILRIIQDNLNQKNSKIKIKEILKNDLEI